MEATANDLERRKEAAAKAAEIAEREMKEAAERRLSGRLSAYATTAPGGRQGCGRSM